MKIITNGKVRELVRRYDLPKKVWSDFDYVADEFEYRFVCYRGAWYDTQCAQGITTQPHRMGWAMHVKIDDPLAKWDSILGETYFSGVLFRETEEGVVCGSYFS